MNVDRAIRRGSPVPARDGVHRQLTVSIFRSGASAQTLGEYMKDAIGSGHEETQDVDKGFEKDFSGGPSQNNPGSVEDD